MILVIAPMTREINHARARECILKSGTEVPFVND